MAEEITVQKGLRFSDQGIANFHVLSPVPGNPGTWRVQYAAIGSRFGHKSRPKFLDMQEDDIREKALRHAANKVAHDMNTVGTRPGERSAAKGKRILSSSVYSASAFLAWRQRARA